MKRTTAKIILIFTLVVTIAISGFAQKRLKKIVSAGEIRIGMTGNQPPFSMQSKGDSLIGYEVDLANLLADAMGVKARIIQIPFSELLVSLEEGKIDAIMSGMTITPKRNLRVPFVGPYIVSGKSILTKSAALANITDSDDLNRQSMKLVALKGSTSEDFVKRWLPKATLIVATDYDQAVKMVLNDKADALFADFPICAYTYLRYPKAKLYILEEPLTIEPIGIALPADDPLLLNLVQNYFTSIQLVGILDLLEEMWFGSGDWLDEVQQ